MMNGRSVFSDIIRYNVNGFNMPEENVTSTKRRAKLIGKFPFNGIHEGGKYAVTQGRSSFLYLSRNNNSTTISTQCCTAQIL